MKNTTLRNKVEAKLLKCNNANSVKEMMDKNFEYAASKYSSLKTIFECIISLH